MRVAFEFDLNDLAETHLRLLARSKVAQRWKWLSVLGAGLITAAVIMTVLPGDLGIRTTFAVVAAAMMMFLQFWFYEWHLQRRMVRFYQEQIGSRPLVCTVELSAEGIRAFQVGTELFFDWGQISAIEARQDAIDFFSRAGGLVVVRDRAFESPEEMREFLDLANRYRDEWQLPTGIQEIS